MTNAGEGKNRPSLPFTSFTFLPEHPLAETDAPTFTYLNTCLHRADGCLFYGWRFKRNRRVFVFGDSHAKP